MNEESAKERVRRARERLQDKPTIVQLALAAVGLVLILVGLVMLVTPGPAFIVIPLGLALLSLRFEPAGKLVDRIIDKAAAASRLPQGTKLVLAAGSLTIASAVAFLVLR